MSSTLPPNHPPAVLRVMPMPADANIHGDVFGGWIMSQVDIAGSIPATRRAAGRVATVAVNAFTFKQPVFVGDLLSFYATITHTGRTSITVSVEVYAERQRMESEAVKVTEATLTYVATDENRQSRPLPPSEDPMADQSALETTAPVVIPRRLDPEDAQLALQELQSILKRQEVVDTLAQRQHDTEDEDGSNLLEGMLQRQHEDEIRQIINALHPADIAFILESLPVAQRQAIWQLVRQEYDADVLLEVEDWVRESLIESMDHEDLIAATGNMDADEIADLAPDLPPDVIAEVQKGLTDAERAQLIAAMGYPEDTVGAIMDFDMVRVREDITLEVVLRYLRRLHELPDHTDQIFVVDRADQLRGTLSLSRLLLSEPDTLVSAVMEPEVLSLNPLDSDADAASAFERYDLVSAPVVDEQGRLIGRVTIDEVVDVLQEDSQEQELSRAGLQEEDIFAPVLSALRNRAPWLLVNLCTASIASLVASRFEDTVSHIVILAFLMSIVAGIGGNSGNQTMTMIIRAMATGRVTGANIWQLVKRELQVTFLVGACGSLVAATFAWVISESYAIAAVMMAAMVGNMLIGAALGVLIPLLRDRFGKDPAVGSSVLLTFATDSLGFFLFLGLATVFLL